MNDIEVKVSKNGSRKFFIMYWKDPVSGDREQRSTKVVNDKTRKSLKAALGVAKQWESEIRSGKRQSSRISWDDFRGRYETEVLASLADKSDHAYGTALNKVEDILRPVKLCDVTAGRLSTLQSKMRETGLAEASVRSYLGCVAAALSWAVDMDMIEEAPKVKMPRRAKGQRVMKGRPIATEEFERLLATVDRFVIRDRSPITSPLWAPSWKGLLRGLWWSGLRLDEALNLYWDRPDRLHVDMTGCRRPMFRILAEHEKGRRDRYLPMAPEFAEFLDQTPEDERRGRVFKLVGKRGNAAPMSVGWVSSELCRFGKRAGIKVHVDTKTGKVKFASAHDLRRSFGERWSRRVLPQVLMELMRHENIQTTQKYYIGRNAEATADIVWQAVRTSVGSDTENAVFAE